MNSITLFHTKEEQVVTGMISSFRGEYRFLSNFYIEPDGTHVEGEFQSAKCANLTDKNKFTHLIPGEAKKLGRQVGLRSDWEFVKDKIMLELVLKKFNDHKALRLLLKYTEPKLLVEGNTWGDTYWGVCKGVGENKLGVILMQIRRLI